MSIYLPDWKSQPQYPVAARLLSGQPVNFLWLPSVGNASYSPYLAPTVTGNPGKEARADGIAAKISNADRLSWGFRANTTRFTVLFRGYVSAPSTSFASWVLGQFAQNSALNDASGYDWGIYEGAATDVIAFFVSNGSTSVSIIPPNSQDWRSKTVRTIAASFGNGVPKISVDGSPVATGSTLTGSAIASSRNLACGGYFFNATTYDPGPRPMLAAVANGYTALDAELQAMSANPWAIFAPPRLRTYFLSSAAGTQTGAGASDITFTTSGAGASAANAAGTSDITFATTARGSSLANAAGASDITFATSGVGQSSSSGAGVGASDITFATSGAGASIASAAGSASLTFTTTGVAEGQAQTATQTAPAGRGKRRRRFILPNNAEIFATQEEVNEILRAFVKPKPTKKKVAKIVPLADQIEAKEETRGNEVVERISVKPVALWKPDPALYEEMVRRVVARRQRRELEFLLLAA